MYCFYVFKYCTVLSAQNFLCTKNYYNASAAFERTSECMNGNTAKQLGTTELASLCANNSKLQLGMGDNPDQQYSAPNQAWLPIHDSLCSVDSLVILGNLLRHLRRRSRGAVPGPALLQLGCRDGNR